MKQTSDFLAECEALSAVLDPLDGDDFARPTQFKGWRIEDVFVHLYFWNLQADQSIFRPDEFSKTIVDILPDIQKRGMRPVENEHITLRGATLVETWRDHYRDFCARLDGIDPKMRVKWAGPDMSVRSSITARQMETWAHGHEVFEPRWEKFRTGDNPLVPEKGDSPIFETPDTTTPLGRGKR